MAKTQELQWAWFDQGVKQERARILKAIADAPPSMDFFGPYIAKEKLDEVIRGETA